MTLNNISIFRFSTEQVQISFILCSKQSTLCLTEKPPDNDDDDDDDYDSSNDDDDSVDDDFNENDDSGNDDGGGGGGDDGGDNGEDDADNDDGDENDNNMDITGDDEITEEHELSQQFHELSLEGQTEDVGESDLEKDKIHEYVLTNVPLFRTHCKSTLTLRNLPSDHSCLFIFFPYFERFF